MMRVVYLVGLYYTYSELVTVKNNSWTLTSAASSFNMLQWSQSVISNILRVVEHRLHL